MCLSTQALVLFLNVIGSDLVTSDPGRIIVAAESGAVHWVLTSDDEWCTMAPQLDRLARFSPIH